MDDSWESWLHDLEMEEPSALFPELYSQKNMYDSSSSSSGFEITDDHEKHQKNDDEIWAEKLIMDHDYYQSNNSMINNIIKADEKPKNNKTSVSSFAGVNNKVSFSTQGFQISNGNNNNHNNNNNYNDYYDDVQYQCEKKPRKSSLVSPMKTNWIEFEGQSGDDTCRHKVIDSSLPHHIVVERKRRQDLNHRFLALSQVVPGNKKRDKASILGEAVKYMTDLQDRIKKLEEKRNKKVVESVVFVHRSSSSSSCTHHHHHHQYWSPNNNNNNYSNCNNNYCNTMDDDNNNNNNYYGESNDDNFSNKKSILLPEIEAKVIERERSVLIRVHCENVNNNNNSNVVNNGEGVLPILLSEMPKLHLIVVTTNVVPFGNDTDITLIAQMGDDFCIKTKDIVEHLRLALPNFI